MRKNNWISHCFQAFFSIETRIRPFDKKSNKKYCSLVAHQIKLYKFTSIRMKEEKTEQRKTTGGSRAKTKERRKGRG